MKYALKLSACLAVSVLLGCASSTLPDSGEWVDQPPPLDLCEPGQEVIVDADLIANCTALTKDVGDWLLGLVQQGSEILGWVF